MSLPQVTFLLGFVSFFILPHLVLVGAFLRELLFPPAMRASYSFALSLAFDLSMTMDSNSRALHPLHGGLE